VQHTNVKLSMTERYKLYSSWNFCSTDQWKIYWELT